MKKVKFRENGIDKEILITFIIFDISSGIFDEPFETHAKDTRDALQIYLNTRGRKDKFIRSKDKDVSYSVRKVFIEDGIRYRIGKCVWYKVI